MATLNRNVTSTTTAPFTQPSRPGATAEVERMARQLADELLRERDQARERMRMGRVYTTFDPVDDILPNNIETVTRGQFFGNTGSLTTMFTSSLLTATQKSYWQEIYSTGDPNVENNANVEFSIAYGHYNGSGSVDTTGNLNNDTPSRAIYRQWAQLLLPPNDAKFTFNGTDSDSVYILNFNRARIREKIDPGNFELTLARLSGSIGTAFANSAHTGSNVRVAGDNSYFQIIDDSSIVTGGTIDDGKLVYNLISGSIDNGTQVFNPSSPVYYGLLYPQYGVAVLNANKLDLDYSSGGLNFMTVTGSGVQGDNAMKMFTSISSSNDMTPAGRNGGVQSRSSEQVKSTYYFVRVKNSEYNYSNNPSFVTGSLGELYYNSFIQEPQVYITGIGLYNDRRELLAVAKLSQPLLKNYTREANIMIKLDF